MDESSSAPIASKSDMSQRGNEDDHSDSEQAPQHSVSLIVDQWVRDMQNGKAQIDTLKSNPNELKS